MMTTAIVAILVFGLLVFFHELGHFGVAKLVGIRVHEFAIGMGPKLIQHKHRGTVYALRVFPIGGFVRMEGEDENSSASDSFSQKTVKARISVILAGPLMNFILGFMCFFLIFFSLGVPGTHIGDMIPNSPAQEAGLQSGDKVVEIDGEEINTWEKLVAEIASSGGNQVEVIVNRQGETLRFSVTPRFDEATGRLLIGIIPGLEKSLPAAFRNSFEQSKFIFSEIFSFLRQLIRGQADTADVAGPVGIISLVGQASRSGWMDVVGLAGLISINLGIMNLLPIPALDGSRIIFLLIEGLRGRPIDPEKEAMVHMIGITLLMLLMVVITYKDILTFF
ncbi:RIP metalloprotease RseP [Anoxynatronum sibiricum]|uniref:Zinc metalloprotease n=1 Tax=Anoxynatronum sibiricum TaxID=210623 RepID=A0ABU9VQH2_9CLOT